MHDTEYATAVANEIEMEFFKLIYAFPHCIASIHVGVDIAAREARVFRRHVCMTISRRHAGYKCRKIIINRFKRFFIVVSSFLK